MKYRRENFAGLTPSQHWLFIMDSCSATFAWQLRLNRKNQSKLSHSKILPPLKLWGA